jgi:hypothetical protein
MSKVTDLKKWKEEKKAGKLPPKEEPKEEPKPEPESDDDMGGIPDDMEITPRGIALGALYSMGMDDKQADKAVDQILGSIAEFMIDTEIGEIVLEDGELVFIYPDEMEDEDEEFEPEEEL